MTRTFALVAAASALAALPTAAQAAPQRSSAPIAAEAEEVRGRGLLLPVLVALALALAIFVLFEEDSPQSP